MLSFSNSKLVLNISSNKLCDIYIGTNLLNQLDKRICERSSLNRNYEKVIDKSKKFGAEFFKVDYIEGNGKLNIY